MNEDFTALRAAVRTILEHPKDRDWSVQGFGMMRTYFDTDKRWRLNVWNGELAVPRVSIVHDHPWDFVSWILAGHFCNVRFDDVTGQQVAPLLDMDPTYNGAAGWYDWMVIKTGEGGGPDGDRGSMLLKKQPDEHYHPGQIYRQVANEIHASYYTPGTVTLNDRTRREDGEHAKVFWPRGTQWVDAEPRKATVKEVRRTLELALTQFNMGDEHDNRN